MNNSAKNPSIGAVLSSYLHAVTAPFVTIAAQEPALASSSDIPRPTPGRPLMRMVAVAATLAVVGTLAISPLSALSASATAPTRLALINADTVSGGMSSKEATAAAAAGLTVEVVTGAKWDAMSAAQFGQYDLLIAGDAYCSSIASSFRSNETTWAPVVLGAAGGRTVAGNRVVVGTDPVLHGHSGVINTGIKYAGSQPGRTGLYFDASCGGNYYGQAGLAATMLQQLSTGTGKWTENDSPPCGGRVAVIASTPLFSSLTSAELQGWGCSVHETFPTFASDWSALAVATDAQTQPVCGVDTTTGLKACGEAYVLIAGSDIVVSAPDLKLSPLTGSDAAGSTHEVTATVTRSGAALAGQTVKFTISGINASTAGACSSGSSCVTDSAGQVTFTYADTHGAGDDTIYATYIDSSTGSTQSASAAEHWTASVAQTISVHADNQTMTAGAVDPSFTYSTTSTGSHTLTSPALCTVPGKHTTAGVYIITCAGATAPTGDSIAYSTGSLTVNAGPLASITITPAVSSLTAGDSVTYTTEGFDGFRNSRGDATGDTTFSVADGTAKVHGSTVTFTTAGDTTVTATDDIATASATVHITAGSLASLAITPDSAKVISEKSITFTTTGADQFDNTLGDQTSATTFTTNDPSDVVVGNVITFTTGGNRTVTATENGVSITSTIVVEYTAVQSATHLGAAGTFSILAGAATTIPGSTISGDVGADAALTISNTKISGILHDQADAATNAALADLGNAYMALKALTPTGELAGDDLGSLTILPGVYHRVAALAATSTITFDAQGDPNARFIIQSDAALNTTAGTKMILTGKAQASNIFWVTTGAATLGASSTFMGTIVSKAAITLGAGTTLNGRAFSVTAAVTLDANTITLGDNR